jgi:hypothetical protein
MVVGAADGRYASDMRSGFGIVSEWPGNAQNNQAEPARIEVKMDLKYLRCKTKEKQ